MKKKLIAHLFLTILISITVCSCKPKNDVRDTQMPADASSNWTEAAIQKIVIPGKPKAEIDAILGQPGFEDTLPNVSTMAIYDLLNDDRYIAWMHRFSGIQVFYTNGRVESWVTNYSTRTIRSKRD
jgi:hypothetical protein